MKAEWSHLSSGHALVWFYCNKTEATLLSNKELQTWSQQVLVHGPWPQAHTLFALTVLTVLGKNIPTSQGDWITTLNYVRWSYSFQSEDHPVQWLLLNGSSAASQLGQGQTSLHAHVSADAASASQSWLVPEAVEQLPGYDVLPCFLPSLLWDMAKVKHSALAAGHEHS